jgi:hypothetical protein
VLAFRVDSFSLSLLAAGRKLLAAGRKLLAAGRKLLAAGRKLLVAGRNAQIQYAAGRTRLR